MRFLRRQVALEGLKPDGAIARTVWMRRKFTQEVRASRESLLPLRSCTS